MTNRIVTHGCPKCQGALREELEEGEWTCMNCGKMFLFKKTSSPPESLRSPRLPGGKYQPVEIVEEKSTLETLKEDPILGSEDLGDDSEWERLNPLKLVNEKLLR